jgi:hypothetical protein
MGSGNERVAAGVLLAALLFLSGVVVWVREPGGRLVLSLVAVSAALWAAFTVAGSGRRSPLPAGADRRRYHRLRAQTDVLLDRVRQMNRVAAQARAGRRPPDDAEEELNRIEEEVYLLVPELRRAAGRAD